MSALAAVDRDRLTKLLGLFGSAYDGEVANAGRLADRLVRSAGLTWSDIIAPALSSREHGYHGDTASDPLHGDWRTAAARCACQIASNSDPLFASNIDPSSGDLELIHVMHRRDPRP